MAPLPDKGFINTKGTTSLGNPIILATGDIKLLTRSNNLALLNIFTATIIANKIWKYIGTNL